MLNKQAKQEYVQSVLLQSDQSPYPSRILDLFHFPSSPLMLGEIETNDSASLLTIIYAA